MKTWGVVAGVSAVAVASAGVSIAVPGPYMDEIFHVPQTQAYCRGDVLHWDPKITTPPGLYLLGTVLGVVFGCEAYVLRVVNGLLWIGVLVMVDRLLKQLHPGADAEERTLRALILAMFPLVFFFATLYYTDVGSLFFVLVSYDLMLRRRIAGSAAAGAVALLFRQTNIIWVGFVAGCAVVRRLEGSGRTYLLGGKVSLPTRIARYARAALNMGFKKWAVYGPYFGVLAAFVVFVVANEGIVLGDRSAHEPEMHFAQLLYFLPFATFFSLFSGVVFLPQALQAFTARPQLTSLFAIVAVAMVHYGTVAHAYLLADNRHYTFYVWRLFTAVPALKFAVIPVYVVLFLMQQKRLEQLNTRMWTVLFWSATAAVLIPSPLLEFRYFIIPFVLLQLHTAPPTWGEMLVDAVLYTGINGVTIVVFAFYPRQDDTLRFMW